MYDCMGIFISAQGQWVAQKGTVTASANIEGLPASSVLFPSCFLYFTVERTSKGELFAPWHLRSLVCSGVACTIGFSTDCKSGSCVSIKIKLAVTERVKSAARFNLGNTAWRSRVYAVERLRQVSLGWLACNTKVTRVFYISRVISSLGTAFGSAF